MTLCKVEIAGAFPPAPRPYNLDVTTIQPRAPREPIVPPGQVEHHAADMSVTFSADLTLAELQRQLAEKSQWLPIDGAPHDDAIAGETGGARWNLGQMVLRNSTGPLRLGFGGWRDLLLGAQFINGRGELITVGGRVVKNVAGYDLTKLLVGSHGVFGTPITLTTRTCKRPAGAVHAHFDRGALNLPELLASPMRPQWISQSGQIVVGYLGDADTLNYYRNQLAGMSARVVNDGLSVDEDAGLRHKLWPAGSARCRVSVPPDMLDEFIDRSKLWPYLADPAFGIVLSGGGMDVDRAAIRSAARAVGGQAMFFDESGRFIEMSMDPAAFDVLKRLKSAFDPDGSLTPLPANIA